MPAQRREPTDEDVQRYAEWRAEATRTLDGLLEQAPTDRLERCAWAVTVLGPDHPVTIDAVRAAKYSPPAWPWAYILAALGEENSRNARQNWQRAIKPD